MKRSSDRALALHASACSCLPSWDAGGNPELDFKVVDIGEGARSFCGGAACGDDVVDQCDVRACCGT